MYLNHGITTEMLAKAICEGRPYQDHYYIGRFPDGSYLGVTKYKVKSRKAAGQLRSIDTISKKSYIIEDGVTFIKVMKRKNNNTDSE